SSSRSRSLHLPPLQASARNSETPSRIVAQRFMAPLRRRPSMSGLAETEPGNRKFGSGDPARSGFQKRNRNGFPGGIMTEVSLAPQEIAQPIVDALTKAFLLDRLSVRMEVRTPEARGASADVVVWYEMSILSQGEMQRLLKIAEATRSTVTVIPDDKNRMKVELSLPTKTGRWTAKPPEA